MLLFAGFAILLSSGWPMFYVSRRRIFRARVGRILKLRVMVRNADSIVNRGTVPITDERFLNIPLSSPLYTRVGRFLERCSLTELPQLFNVLRGDMSVIGNRPLPENVVSALREAFPDAERRFATKTGLAGPVQLVGRDRLCDAERLDLEIAYCELCERSYSPRLDLFILVNTVLVCLRLRRRFSIQEVKDAMRRYARKAAAAPVCPDERARLGQDAVENLQLFQSVHDDAVAGSEAAGRRSTGA